MAFHHSLFGDVVQFRVCPLHRHVAVGLATKPACRSNFPIKTSDHPSGTGPGKYAIDSIRTNTDFPTKSRTSLWYAREPLGQVIVTCRTHLHRASDVDNVPNVPGKPKSKCRSDCTVRISLEIFGDRWSLLIIRDLLIRGCRTFKEFN